MQTKQDIEQLLASAGAAPNKRLGQHFLIDLNLMRLLVGSAGLTQDDIALEVGCGTGSLTEGLAQAAGKVIAVEYDHLLAGIAMKKLAEFSNVEVISVDVLESKNNINHCVLERIEAARKEFTGRLILVANLPYNVASSLMLNLISGPQTADAMYATVQKEVAERMVAGPDHDEYGALSIFISACGEVHIFRKLPASVFWPRPQVESAMISFIRNPQKIQRIHDMHTFKKVVHLFMNHRRKMLKACVKFADNDLARIHDWPRIFGCACVEPHHRPEDLSAEEYICIANLCYEMLR